MATGRGLGRDTSLLSAAALLEYALQLVLPVLLVRLVSPQDFGAMRALLLVSVTLQGVAVLSLPRAMFNFLPGADAPRRRQVVAQALWLLAALSLVCGLAFGLLAAAGQLGGAFELVGRAPLAAGGYVVLWLLGSLLDTLPTASGRVRFQALATVTLGLVRTGVLAALAWWRPGFDALLAGLLVFAALKVLLLAVFVVRDLGWRGWRQDRAASGELLRYAAPLAVGDGLFALRQQADQWVVSSTLDAAALATLSVAAVVGSVPVLVRQPINNALLPRARLAWAEHRPADLAALLRISQQLVAVLLMPLLVLVALLAPDLVRLVYTQRFDAAAPLMQLYLCGALGALVAPGFLLAVIGQNVAGARIAAGVLLVSALGGALAVRHAGVAGAVMASAAALVAGEWWAMRVVLRTLQVPLSAVLDVGRLRRLALLCALALGAGVLARMACPDPVRAGLAWWRLACSATAFGLVFAVGAWRQGLWSDLRQLLAQLKA